MEHIICVSSGSDGDSDLEVISSYNEEKEEAVAFIRAQWLPVTPVSLAYYFQEVFSVSLTMFCVFFSRLLIYQFLRRT